MFSTCQSCWKPCENMQRTHMQTSSCRMVIRLHWSLTQSDDWTTLGLCVVHCCWTPTASAFGQYGHSMWHWHNSSTFPSSFICVLSQNHCAKMNIAITTHQVMILSMPWFSCLYEFVLIVFFPCDSHLFDYDYTFESVYLIVSIIHLIHFRSGRNSKCSKYTILTDFSFFLSCVWFMKPAKCSLSLRFLEELAQKQVLWGSYLMHCTCTKNNKFTIKMCFFCLWSFSWWCFMWSGEALKILFSVWYCLILVVWRKRRRRE